MRHLLLAVLLLGTAEMPAPPPVPPTVTITVQPSSRDEYQLLRRATPETYSCEVLVTDAALKEAFGEAHLVAAPGRRETITTTHKNYSVEFTVKVNPQKEANRVNTDVVVRRDNVIVAEQHSAITLLPSTPRYLPLD